MQSNVLRLRTANTKDCKPVRQPESKCLLLHSLPWAMTQLMYSRSSFGSVPVQFDVAGRISFGRDAGSPTGILSGIPLRSLPLEGTCGGATNSLDLLRLDLPQSVDLADQDCHAQILEGSRVCVAALLDPEVSHTQCLSAKTLRPEQIRVALKHADNVIVTYLLQGSLPSERSLRLYALHSSPCCSM